MMEDKAKKNNNPIVDAMFKVGAHFGRSKSRRHPSTKSYIFGKKNNTEIIDLEKTVVGLDEAKKFISGIIASGRQVLFVGTKPEAKKIIIDMANSVGIPSVTERWIGGTFTNFDEIKKRVARLENLTQDKESGDLDKYTKKEQLMLDRDMEKLTKNFGGIVSMKGLPSALFVVDPKHEKTAVAEAVSKGIPIIALASSDCDINNIDYPIVANDASQASIEYFVGEMMEAHKEGQGKIQTEAKEETDITEKK